MATYRVIQDIEAEDKLLGPLSLRQFIYAVIVVILCYIMFRVFFLQPLLILPFLLPALLFGTLAAPFGHDQSSEIWLLAKIRFFLKPHLRIWDQTGLQQLVSITVPKKVDEHLTNGLDQTQVKSRLKALAQTIDTRGWAVKGVDVNLYTNPAYVNQSSDRLVAAGSVAPTPVADTDINPGDDILDTQYSPVAQQMSQLVQANDQAHRQALMDRMDQIRNSQAAPAPAAAPVPVPVAPVAQPQPAALPALPTLPPQHNAYGQTPVLQPDNMPAPAVIPNPVAQPVIPVTQPVKPAILGLARNDDLSVATIARQANKSDTLGDDEVVISLR